MNLTVKAVLARFNGDRSQAVAYCYQIIDQYPKLRAEYQTVIDMLTGGSNAV